MNRLKSTINSKNINITLNIIPHFKMMKGITASTNNQKCLYINDLSKRDNRTQEYPVSAQSFQCINGTALNANHLEDIPGISRSVSPQNGCVSSEYHINQYHSLMQKSNFDQEILNIVLKSVNKSQAPLKNSQKNKNK